MILRVLTSSSFSSETDPLFPPLGDLLSAPWGPPLSPPWPSAPVHIPSIPLLAHSETLEADSFFLRTSPLPSLSTQSSLVPLTPTPIPVHPTSSRGGTALFHPHSHVFRCLLFPTAHTDPSCFHLGIHRCPPTPPLCRIPSLPLPPRHPHRPSLAGSIRDLLSFLLWIFRSPPFFSTHVPITLPSSAPSPFTCTDRVEWRKAGTWQGGVGIRKHGRELLSVLFTKLLVFDRTMN